MFFFLSIYYTYICFNVYNINIYKRVAPECVRMRNAYVLLCVFFFFLSIGIHDAATTNNQLPETLNATLADGVTDGGRRRGGMINDVYAAYYLFNFNFFFFPRTLIADVKTEKAIRTEKK